MYKSLQFNKTEFTYLLLIFTRAWQTSVTFNTTNSGCRSTSTPYNVIGMYPYTSEILFIVAATRNDISFSSWSADSKTIVKSNKFAMHEFISDFVYMWFGNPDNTFNNIHKHYDNCYAVIYRVARHTFNTNRCGISSSRDVS